MCDPSGGQGLLAQVEGRTAQTVTDWLTQRSQGSSAGCVAGDAFGLVFSLVGGFGADAAAQVEVV